MAKSRHKVVIARSRVPIVAGELLRGVSLFPSIFVIVNVLVLFLVFAAMLAVDADKRKRWEPSVFRNITT